MEAPAKGAVVLVRFPFSDLSPTKLRPAVVLPTPGVAITSSVRSPASHGDPVAVVLDETALASGTLRVTGLRTSGKASSPRAAI